MTKEAADVVNTRINSEKKVKKKVFKFSKSIGNRKMHFEQIVFITARMQASI